MQLMLCFSISIIFELGFWNVSHHSALLLNRQGSASQPMLQASGFHPFIGTRLNLLATGIANQARLASASNTIPRQVSLPLRGRRLSSSLLVYLVLCQKSQLITVLYKMHQFPLFVSL